MKAKAEASRIYDPGAQVLDPLLLPSGCIRGLLTGGFIFAAFMLHGQGRLLDPDHLEFFVVLAGLILGHYFAKLIGKVESPAFHGSLNHAKGLVVLGAPAGWPCCC